MADYNYYHYQPSLPLAVIALVLFGLATIGIGYHTIKHKSWYFSAFLIGGLCEVVGYIVRVIGRNDTTLLGPYVVQGILLLIPPVLFAASIYMTLKRIILFVGAPEHSIIRVSRLTKLFVWADGVSLFVQASGSGLQAATESPNLPKIGKWIVIVGLAVQLLAFTLFLTVAGIFHSRVRRDSRFIQGLPWERLLHVLYISGALIMVRSVFRVAEYAMGYDGYLMSTEVYFYIFDALLMWLTMALYVIYFPAATLARPTVLEYVYDGSETKGTLTPERPVTSLAC